MKNSVNRLISVAVMIALLLTSCVIPMSAMAGTRVISESADGLYRVVINSTKDVEQRNYEYIEKLGTAENHTKKEMTVKRTYSRDNKRTYLSIGANADKRDLNGLPGNISTKTFNVKLKPFFTVTFYGKRYSYRMEWQHLKLYQRWRFGSGWETYKTESSRSIATGNAWSFEQSP